MTRWLLLAGSGVGLLTAAITGPSTVPGSIGLALGAACLLALLWSRGRRADAQPGQAPQSATDLWKALDAGLDPTDDGPVPAPAHDKLGADDARSVIPPSQETR